ncbi:uncharacterized protein FFMR_03353 [Fusarium fujikuroi]|nr:uncharacterized protein FFMR_03353 [Fusarium fujikuroi]SCV26645.1 uncharacterized protein FFB14_01165 [Fusarium fujikuroi]
MTHRFGRNFTSSMYPALSSASAVFMPSVSTTVKLWHYPNTMQVARCIQCFSSLRPGRATEKLCDLQIAEWRVYRESDKPLECEDCLLEPSRIELEAGISYNGVEASEFEDITSSCSATG